MSTRDDNYQHELATLNLEVLQERLAAIPDDVDALVQIGNRHREIGNLDQAENYYRQALKLNADDPWAQIYLGSLHLLRREYQESIARFSRACELLPDFACPYWCLANVYSAMGKADLAESNYKLAVSVQPDDQQAKRLLREWYEDRYMPD